MDWFTRIDLVQLANALVILIVGLAAGLGWKKGRAEPASLAPAGTVEVAGALVDSQAVKALGGEVAGLTIALTAHAAAVKDLARVVDDHRRALTDHREEMEEHRGEMRARRHGH